MVALQDFNGVLIINLVRAAAAARLVLLRIYIKQICQGYRCFPTDPSWSPLVKKEKALPFMKDFILQEEVVVLPE